MKNKFFYMMLAATGVIFASAPSKAEDFKYRSEVTLTIGQSVILKGVRQSNCSDQAPGWKHIKRKLPKSGLGKFVDGGAGTTDSNSCGQNVAARGVKFIAQKSGSEMLEIFKDPISITVKD